MRRLGGNYLLDLVADVRRYACDRWSGHSQEQTELTDVFRNSNDFELSLAPSVSNRGRNIGGKLPTAKQAIIDNDRMISSY